MLTPVEFPAFSGLNLRSDAQEVAVGAAIDMVDIDLDLVGRVRARDGYGKFTPSANTYNFVSAAPYYTSAGTAQLIGTEDSPGVRAYDTAGAPIGGAAATWAASGSTGWASFAQVGTASASYLYIANGKQTVWRWDGTNFTQPAGFAAPVTVDGSLLAVQPRSNRLVVAGLQSNFSRVVFSEGSAPETFGVNNWVDLLPNDGETIRGLCAWGDFVIAFKRTKFFVFTGNSKDGVGEPIFNYRTVNTGVGCAGFNSCVAAPEGVYFLADDGVYLTQGGPAVKVSAPMDPFFHGLTHQYFSFTNTRASMAAIGATSMAYIDGRLYIRGPFGAAAAAAVVVFEPATNNWLYWSVALGSFIPYRASSTGQQVLMFNMGHYVYQFGTSYTTDDSVAISARYRSGFWNAGQPGGETVVREWLVDGIGTVTVKTAVNDAVTLGSGASVTLGTSPAVAQGRDRRAVRGRNISMQISGTGPWSVSRSIANVRAQRNAESRAT